MISAKKITAEYARSILNYDPETGIITWRVLKGPNAKAGKEAGGLSTQYYLQIKIDGVSYKMHRVAFLLHHGRWPVGNLKHLNKKRRDNRASNLIERRR